MNIGLDIINKDMPSGRVLWEQSRNVSRVENKQQGQSPGGTPTNQSINQSINIRLFDGITTDTNAIAIYIAGLEGQEEWDRGCTGVSRDNGLSVVRKVVQCF